MKVVIARMAPQKIRRMMRAEFPTDWQVVVVPAQSLIDEIGDADAIIPEGSPVDVELLENANNLKIIQTGAGYDNINIEECRRRGIRVANAAGINARAVAEHVLAYIFTWYKNIIKLNSAIKSGKFAVDYSGSELDGHVIGVVGLGRIGREVARMSQALGLEVIGYHYRQAADARGIDRMDLHSLLKQADIVTVHVALNELQPVHSEEKEADRKIPAVILPEGYTGKILLVSLSGDGLEKMIVLRSGDLWHREILRNTEAEIRNLGFHSARVSELGGAHLRFESGGTIVIHGTSEQYGACDKEHAARLVRNEFPGRRIEIRS